MSSMSGRGSVGKKPLRVLLVEDNRDDAELILRELRRGGYDPSFQRVAQLDEFVGALDSQEWELLLCDYTMSGFSGTQALALVRSRGSDVPFIFVSGTIGEETAVSAMRSGAQDYVVKGNLRRLVPAIERELREAEMRRDRIRADAERRAAERRIRDILAMAPDAIVAVDGDQRITLFNRAAEALFGYTADEVTGQLLELLLPARFAAAHRRMVKEFAGADQQVRPMNLRGEVFGRRKNGEEFPAEASISKTIENGDVGLMAVVRDITQRKLLEEQLRQAQKMEAVGQLTGGLAHDFNNLLTVVIGNLDLLQETAGTDSVIQGSVQRALGASLRGAQLTRQLLAFSRRQPLETRVFDLNELVAGTTDLLRRTLGAQIEVDMVLGNDLWRAMADPTQVEAALVNLSINARDAMPTGGRLTIETSNRTLDAAYATRNVDLQPGSYVELAVSDTGTGMPAHVREKVFEPFFTTKEKGRGTGLGLSMVYGFAKQSGGHVNIYSEVGQGTTVRLYLPRAAPDSDLSADQPPEAIGDRPFDATILVVEDDAAVREVAVSQLTALGYRVIEVENGRSALELLAGDQPVHLLFTDVIMPGSSSGPDLARQAKKLRGSLKVLFTSGYAEASLRNGDLGAEIDHLLSKPYRKEDLARKVREVLRS